MPPLYFQQSFQDIALREAISLLGAQNESLARRSFASRQPFAQEDFFKGDLRFTKHTTPKIDSLLSRKGGEGSAVRAS